MKNFKTEQEAFWAGEFGNEYIERNQDTDLQTRKILRFAEVIKRTAPFDSLIEFGSNIGLNLRAIHSILPNVELSAIEINAKAVERLKQWGVAKVYHQSILEFKPDYQREMAIICGVLIHINPDELKSVYQALYNSSKRYVYVSEYFNPTPVEVPYRGHSGKLFKRDFAGEMMDMFPDLHLVDYGFGYNRDPRSAGDDGTWFLMEKRSSK